MKRALIIIVLLAPLLTFLLPTAFSATASSNRDSSSLAFANIFRPNSKKGPTEVEVGVWLADIDSINSSSQNFVANIFVALQWKDPRLAHPSDDIVVYDIDHVWNPGIQIANEIGLVRRTFPEVVYVDPDGTVTYRQRYVGSFSQPMDLDDFPFDTQTFRLHFVSPGSRSGDINFVPSKKMISEGLPKAGGIAKDISLPDWNIESFNAYSSPYIIVPGTEVVGYVFDFVAKRDVRHYIWKVILPLFFIVMMSWGVFWIDPSQAGTQIAVATTSMLTLIAYRFAIDSQVPKVPYMTKLDQFTVVGTSLVFLCLIQVLVTARLNYVGNVELARKIDRVSRIVFPIVFIIGLTIALAG